jgi:tetrapyrrole methylase family protein/MazG family protein
MTHVLSISVPPDIIATNVNVFTGDLFLTDTYSPEINPEVFNRLSEGRRAVSFCPELTHLDILGFKLCTIFRLKRVTSLVVLTKDGSPHSMQIPLMVQEAAEDAGFDKSSVEYYCLEGGLVHHISDLTVRKSRHYSEIEKLLPYAKLEAVTAMLRSEQGCPNDRKETYESVIEHLREEVEELAEALRKNDMENFYEESGDILYNLALIGQISNEGHALSLRDIAGQAAQKMIDKHENVFQMWKSKY